MKFKLDENIPERLAEVLATLGHEADTTRSENIVGESDDIVWRECQRERRFLITQDKDFSDARKYRPHPESGVLILRLHNPSRTDLLRRLIEILNTEDLNKFRGKTVVATKQSLRIFGRATTA